MHAACRSDDVRTIVAEARSVFPRGAATHWPRRALSSSCCMGGATVLVVDDNAENRALAEATLDDEAYRVILACDGPSALAAFEAERPDCILLDVRMPGMDGITVCEKLRALPGGDQVAIVFVTAQREVETFDRALAVGGDDFLTKPFRPSELVVRVQAAMRARELAGERSGLYDEVRRQRDALQRLQLHKEQLANFLVHDLKNPVGAIELQAQRVLRDPAATDRSRSAATAIRDEARGLMRMILNLLDLSMADEGRLAPTRAVFDPEPLVDAVFGELGLRAAESQVELVAEVSTAQLVADPELAQRVLTNLLDNAIRHAPEGSAVTVTVREGGEGTEVRVRDAGPGIPEARRPDVFERFESGSPTASRNRGLGLAFCKRVIEAHGGEIWIEDGAPGAVFCLRFPHGPA